MEEQYPQTQFQQDFSRQEEPKKKIWVFLLVPLLILVCGFLMVLAARIWDPVWNPFRPRPEKVLAMTFLKMKELKTVESDTKLFGIFEDEENQKVVIDMRFNQKEDKRDINNPKTEGGINFSASLHGKNVESSFPLGIGFKIYGEGEFKSLNEKFFFKAIKIPGEFFFQSMGIDFSAFQKKWIMVDAESIFEVMEALTEEMAKDNPFYAQIYKEQLKEQKKMLEKGKALEREIEAKIENIIFGKKLFLVKKQLPDKKINGKMAYHYLLILNNEDFSKMIAEIFILLGEIMSKEYGTSFTFDEMEFKKSLKEFLDKLGEISAEVWIGKKDYYLYKITAKKEIDASKLFDFGPTVSSISKETETFTPSIQNTHGKVTIEFETNFNNFNLPFEIKEPADVINIKDLLIPLIESLIEKQKFSKSDETIKSELESIGWMFSFSGEENYSNLCRNKKLNTANEKLRAIQESIQNAQGGTLNLSCYNSASSYCIIAALATPNKGKYCVDNWSILGKEVASNAICQGNGTVKNPYKCP